MKRKSDRKARVASLLLVGQDGKLDRGSVVHVTKRLENGTSLSGRELELHQLLKVQVHFLKELPSGSAERIPKRGPIMHQVGHARRK